MAITINEVPQEALEDIRFMLGSIEACQEYLKPILEQHGYDVDEEGFLMIEPEDDPDLTVDIYNALFVKG